MKLMFTLSDTTQIIRRKIEFCIPSCSSAPNEPSFESPGKPKRIERKTKRIERKKSKTSAPVWTILGRAKTYKGGRRPSAAAPLCRFFCSQNSSNCCWRSWIFSFQSFRACQGSQNWAHWGLSKKEYKIQFFGEVSNYCGSYFFTKLFTLRDSADPVNKDRPMKLTYRSWHGQGSAPGKVGEGAVQRRGSFSAKVPDAYATGVLRYRAQRQNDNPEEKQKVNNLTFSYHFPNNIMLH